ncbi:DNA-3-methyladenine glycosylase family protein [Dongia sedimenti]|uniref:DNA-3-methyladenine glycosylase II n=1 Tax=Dongia sedimenti TaxID=3064282 RepID=A0ABU0YP67_9PROT|nr:DNA-3-methyladenine glycosylase 2 family protein [Rhodospirillaceae bacterium R-7]
MAGRNNEDTGLLQQALDHLARADRHMADAIREIGAPPPRHRPAGFATLMDVIIAQQVSTASARAISGRLTERLSKVTPESFIALTDADLRAVGFSRQKTLYGRDLAAAFQDGRVSLPKLRRMPDEDAIAALSSVKGIGRWSAEVFLLFSLKRPDVMPAQDLALMVAAQRLKGLRARPDPKKLLKIAEPWRPFRSYGARMLWHYYRNGKGGIGGQPL